MLKYRILKKSGSALEMAGMLSDTQYWSRHLGRINLINVSRIMRGKDYLYFEWGEMK